MFPITEIPSSETTKERADGTQEVTITVPDPIPLENPNPLSYTPTHKLLERKFLVGVVTPILILLIRKTGLWTDDQIPEVANYIIDIILVIAPIVWVYVEGSLDKEKIRKS